MQQQAQHNITWETWQNMKARMGELEEKVEVYEKLLHQLDLYSQMGDNKQVAILLQKISDWSYAHRAGNGELSEAETETLINKKFKKLQVWK